MPEQQKGQVIFRSSSNVVVVSEGKEFRCEFRGKLRREVGGIVVGDWVEFYSEGPTSGAVSKVLERRNQLSRRRQVGGGRELILAANIDQVVAFFAARRPRLKFGALDRLLVAAEFHSLPAVIVVNKSELGFTEEIQERLDLYPQIGYPVYYTSVVEGTGLDHCYELFKDKASVVTGPSGVGKSSLLSELLGMSLRVGEVSEANEKGKHTTTAAAWFQIPESRGGGAVVDTPGFREYGIWGLELRDVAAQMPDIFPHTANCRFNDCLHEEEPACGVRQAVEESLIDPERFWSYLGILQSIREQF